MQVHLALQFTYKYLHLRVQVLVAIIIIVLKVGIIFFVEFHINHTGKLHDYGFHFRNRIYTCYRLRFLFCVASLLNGSGQIDFC